MLRLAMDHQYRDVRVATVEMITLETMGAQRGNHGTGVTYEKVP